MELLPLVHFQNFSQPKFGSCRVAFPQALPSPWQRAGTIPSSSESRVCSWTRSPALAQTRRSWFNCCGRSLPIHNKCSSSAACTSQRNTPGYSSLSFTPVRARVCPSGSAAPSASPAERARGSCRSRCAVPRAAQGAAGGSALGLLCVYCVWAWPQWDLGRKAPFLNCAAPGAELRGTIKTEPQACHSSRSARKTLSDAPWDAGLVLCRASSRTRWSLRVPSSPGHSRIPGTWPWRLRCPAAPPGGAGWSCPAPPGPPAPPRPAPPTTASRWRRLQRAQRPGGSCCPGPPAWCERPARRSGWDGGAGSGTEAGPGSVGVPAAPSAGARAAAEGTPVLEAVGRGARWEL